jgi:hypothetical protein
MASEIQNIDDVTAAYRKAAALLRAAEADPPGLDRGWLVSMALEAIEEGEPALRRLNRLDD